MPHKVAFLILDDIHHVHHIAPIAFTLSQTKHYECVIYLQEKCLNLVNKIADYYPEHSCLIKLISPSLFRQIIGFWRRGMPSSRSLIRQRTKELLNFDALVTPDLNLNRLINTARCQKKKPLFFLTFHGGGSRSRPYHLLTDYDLVLLCGENRRRQFQQQGLLANTHYAVTGYTKFDVVPVNYKPKLFENDNRVILYNPHFDLEISSWRPWGLWILDYFYQNPAYNLIFAPHCNLFAKYLSPRQIPAKYFSARNIIIDFGSEQSVDMTYTQAADVYLGDVSSQIFEFIRQPRPCLFLNPHQFDRLSYTYWQLGTVVDDLTEFPALLPQACDDDSYAALQKEYFAETFSLNPQSAAARAAEAISTKLEGSNLLKLQT